MMMPRATVWWAGMALLALANGWVLAAAAYNRSAPTSAPIGLTERELTPAWFRVRSNEPDRIAFFTININTNYYEDGPLKTSRYIGEMEWLGEEKLKELGFDIQTPVNFASLRSRFNENQSRDVFLVLEYEGPAYQKILMRMQQRYSEALLQAKAAPENKGFAAAAHHIRERLERLQHYDSHLFAVDAGRDADGLRRRYPDRSHSLIVRGQIMVDLRVYGRIKKLDVDVVMLPRAFREIIDPYQGQAHYLVKLAYGKRYEPWIVSAELPGQH